MKIIEALKTLKANNKKVEDLIVKIKGSSALLSNQTSPYGDAKETTKMVQGWLDSVRQTLRDNEVLTNRIHRTNSSTNVSIDFKGTVVTKTIDEWLTRRNNGVEAHLHSYLALTDRGLKETFVAQPDGTNVPVTIVRHFNATKRDEAIDMLRNEQTSIDGTLEIVNATTDLVE